MEPIEASRETPALDLRELMRVLRTYWKSITVITLVCALLALGWSLFQTRIYSSTATGLVVASGEQDLSSALAGDNLALSKAVSYGSLATSTTVAESVIAERGLDTVPEQLLKSISAEVPEDTVEIRVTAEALAAQEAQDLANSWVVALAEQVQEIESGDGEGINRVAVQPLNNASLPLEPIAPNRRLNLALGLGAGLVLGLIYAFLRNKMDRRIRSTEEIREGFGVPVLGVIPEIERLADHRAIIDNGISANRGDHAFYEAMRILRTNLSFVSVDRPPKMIVITSPLPGEGKSSITANLAVAIASTGRKVVVVDGDLRRPVITELFEMIPGVGVTDVLTGQVQVDEVLQPYDKFPNLQVLGAGQATPHPTELLSSKAMHNMLVTLAEDALVLVDAPPLLPVTDAALLTASADGAIIVATAERTTTDDLGEALDSVLQVHGTVLGVIMNRMASSRIRASYYSPQNGNNRASDKDDKPVKPSAPALSGELNRTESHGGPIDRLRPRGRPVSQDSTESGW